MTNHRRLVLGDSRERVSARHRRVRPCAGRREQPDVSVLGVALAVFSLITTPLLGIAKQRIAEQIGSAATKGEHACWR